MFRQSMGFRGRQIGSETAGMEGAALEQEGGSLRQLGGIGMLKRHADEFDLTDDQLDKLDEMQVDCEIEKTDLLAALQKAKAHFRSKIRNEDSVEKEVMAAIDEVARCEAEMRKMRYRHLQSGRGVLKANQRKKVKAFRRKCELESAKQQ